MSDVISMVVFSDGKSKELIKTTQNCINSALDNCLNPLLEITVFESNDVVYERCITVKVNEEFNYNKFANDFIKKNIDKSSLFLICNNDLVFLKNWLQPLINANYPIVSSLDPTLKKQLHIKNNEKGYMNKYHLSSWCFMIHKQLWYKIKGFDEDFPFWYADDSLLEQLKKINNLLL